MGLDGLKKFKQTYFVLQQTHFEPQYYFSSFILYLLYCTLYTLNTKFFIYFSGWCIIINSRALPPVILISSKFLYPVSGLVLKGLRRTCVASCCWVLDIYIYIYMHPHALLSTINHVRVGIFYPEIFFIIFSSHNFIFLSIQR